MPPRNLNVILIAGIIAAFCYAAYRRARTAMMVGDALEMINSYYVDPVEDQDLLTAAMNGMTASLDEHSSYIPGDAYETFQNSINQEFAGIGIYVEQPDPEQPVRVITPLVGSPALREGILPDDRIITVDGEDVSRMELRDVSDRLKGPVGTNVKVGVRRAGDKEVTVTVQRETIQLESVIGDHRDEGNDWVYRLQSDPMVAYIRVTSFGEKTVDEVRGILQDLNNDFKALIFDLRGNSGGLLYAARDISDMFLDKGRIVSTRVRGNVIDEVYDASAGTLVNQAKPVAVLIDGDSASASEIVAACLQDSGRATIVGTRSYGKGTVQNILPLQYGRSALRLTVARYYRPSDKNIHRKPDATEDDIWGVTPDEGCVVQLDEETVVALNQHWREASYPMLVKADDEDADEDAEANDSDPQADDESTDAASGTDSVEEPVDEDQASEDQPSEDQPSEDQPSEDPATLPLQDDDPLDYDPQLKRAYDRLMDQLARAPSVAA